MAWAGSLQLAYRSEPLRGAPRTVVKDRHDGPLRVLASLYPEAPAVCHNVLVHPPGGLFGGDALTIDMSVIDGTHALVTTPGATRFYRSIGAPAKQSLNATLAGGARLEWLPLETLAYSGCIARNAMRFDLAPAAEMIGRDVLAAAHSGRHGGARQRDRAARSGAARRAVDEPADRRVGPLARSRVATAGLRAVRLADLTFNTQAQSFAKLYGPPRSSAFL